MAREILEAAPSCADLDARARDFVSTDRQVPSAADALLGAGHILAEQFSERADLRQRLREILQRTGKIVTTQIGGETASPAVAAPAARTETAAATDPAEPEPAAGEPVAIEPTAIEPAPAVVEAVEPVAAEPVPVVVEAVEPVTISLPAVTVVGPV